MSATPLERNARPRRVEQLEAQRAQVAQMTAQLAQVDAALGFAVITAPFAGTISRRLREPASG